MKKIVAIILSLSLFIPPNAFALRPLSAQKASALSQENPLMQFVQKRQQGENIFFPIIAISAVVDVFNKQHNKVYSIADVEMSAEKQIEIMQWLAKRVDLPIIYPFMDLNIEAQAIATANDRTAEAEIGLRTSDEKEARLKPFFGSESEDIASLKIPDPTLSQYMQQTIKFLKQVKKNPNLKNRKQIAFVCGPISLLGKILGEEQAIGLALYDPDRYKEWIGYAKKVIDAYIAALIEAGADGICMLEPSANNVGPNILESLALIDDINDVFDKISTNKKGKPIAKIFHACITNDNFHTSFSQIRAHGFSFDHGVNYTTFAKLRPDAVMIGQYKQTNMPFEETDTICHQGEEMVDSLDGINSIPGTGCEIKSLIPGREIEQLLAFRAGCQPASARALSSEARPWEVPFDLSSDADLQQLIKDGGYALLPGTSNVVVINDRSADLRKNGKCKTVLWDFDETISLIKKGWPRAMTKFAAKIFAFFIHRQRQEELVEATAQLIARPKGMSPVDAWSSKEVKPARMDYKFARRLVKETTGAPSIVQFWKMIELSEYRLPDGGFDEKTYQRILKGAQRMNKGHVERAGKLEEADPCYKKYLQIMRVSFRDRRLQAVRSGKDPKEKHMVGFALALLKRAHNTISRYSEEADNLEHQYAISGSEFSDVCEDGLVLGIIKYIRTIFGYNNPLYHALTKAEYDKGEAARVIQQLEGIPNDKTSQMLFIGDGPNEMIFCKMIGGIAVAIVPSHVEDKIELFERLRKAGADYIVIGDFCDYEAISDYFLNPEYPTPDVTPTDLNRRKIERIAAKSHLGALRVHFENAAMIKAVPGKKLGAVMDAAHQIREIEEASAELSQQIVKSRKDGFPGVKVSIRKGQMVYYVDDADMCLRVVVLDTVEVKKIKNKDLAAHVSAYQATKDLNVIIQSKDSTMQQLVSQGKTIPVLSPECAAIICQIKPARVADNALSAAAELATSNIVLTQDGQILTGAGNMLHAYYRNKLARESAVTVIAAEILGGLVTLSEEQARRISTSSLEADRQKEAETGQPKLVESTTLAEIGYTTDEARRKIIKEVTELRQRLFRAGRTIDETNLVVGPGGNTSYITEDRKIIVIKASGKAFGNMDAESYVAIDYETGKPIAELGLPFKPSVEWCFHKAYYENRPDVRAVVHTHPPVATGFACAKESPDRNIPGAAFIEYLFPGSDDGLPEAVAANAKDYSVIILGNHGLITAGADLEKALQLTVDTERRAEQIINAKIFSQKYAAYQQEAEGFYKDGEPDLDDYDNVQKGNKVMWLWEILWLESDKEQITQLNGLQQNDIVCDVYTKEVLRLPSKSALDLPGDSDMAILARIETAIRRGTLVRLTPSSLPLKHRMQRDALIKQADSRNPAIREAALRRYKELEGAGIFKTPYKLADIFMHCHTTFSYSPYTPCSSALRAYMLGLRVIGNADHDTTAAFNELRKVGFILGIKTTCAYEHRGYPVDDAELMIIPINSPGNPGEVYVAVHGVDAIRNRQFDGVKAVIKNGKVVKLKEVGVRESKVNRFKRMIKLLNKLNPDLHLDYTKDVKPLAELNNPTERHVAEAIARRLCELAGNNPAKTIELTDRLISRVAFEGENLGAARLLENTSILNNFEKFVEEVRNRIVTPLRKLDPPDLKENRPLKEAAEFANSNGWLPFALYLGGKQPCEAETFDREKVYAQDLDKLSDPEIIELFEGSNLIKLFRYYLSIGIDNLAFMPNRNTRRESKAVIRLAKALGFKRIGDGMDVNKKGMPFTYFNYSCEPEFVRETLRIVAREERLKRIQLSQKPKAYITAGELAMAPSILNVPVEDWVTMALETARAGKQEGIKVILHGDYIDSESTDVVQEGAEHTVNKLADKEEEIVEAVGEDGIYDAHLMVTGKKLTDEFILWRIRAGAKIVTIHWEAFKDKKKLLERLQFIRSCGVMAGLAMNPDVDIEQAGNFIEEHSNEIDMVLQMSVFPGKGKQGDMHLPVACQNIYAITTRFNYKGPVQIDGGINTQNIMAAQAAGATIFVAGGAFYHKKDMKPTDLREICAKYRWRLEKPSRTRNNAVSVEPKAGHERAATSQRTQNLQETSIQSVEMEPALLEKIRKAQSTVTEALSDFAAKRPLDEAIRRLNYLSDESRRLLLEDITGDPKSIGVFGLMCRDLFINTEEMPEGAEPNNLALAGDTEGSVDRDGTKTAEMLRKLPPQVLEELENIEKQESGGPANSTAKGITLLTRPNQGGRTKVSLYTSTGKKQAGVFLKRHQDDGTDTSKVHLSKKDMATTYVLQTKYRGRTFWHYVGASADFTIDQLKPEYFEGKEVVEFGGIELTALMPYLPEILLVAKKAGCRVVLDTVVDKGHQWRNFRHRRFEDSGQRWGNDYLRLILPLIDVFVPSLGEACQIMADYEYPGDEARAAERAKELEQNPPGVVDFFISQGAKAVVLKADKNGCYVRSTSHSIFGKETNFRVPIIRGLRKEGETGTGDLFASGITYAVAHGWDIMDAVLFGTACGGICLQYKGGTLGQETLLDALYYKERLRAQMLAEAVLSSNKAVRNQAQGYLRQREAEGFTRFADQVRKEIADLLYLRAFPHTTALPPHRIEQPDFGLGNFDRQGLSLEVVAIHNEGEGRGYTGKILINAPEQFLIEHSHKTIVVLKKGTPIPEGYTPIEKCVNDFKGIREYNNDGTPRPGYKYKATNYRILLADSDTSALPEEFKKQYLVEEIEGKSETFIGTQGDGLLFTDKAEIVTNDTGERIEFSLDNLDELPAGWQPKVEQLLAEQGKNITTRKIILVKAGVVVKLPKNTLHSFLAGNDGAVYVEVSSPSIDEADHFTNPDVKRLPAEATLKDGKKDARIDLRELFDIYGKVEQQPQAQIHQMYQILPLEMILGGKTYTEPAFQVAFDAILSNAMPNMPESGVPPSFPDYLKRRQIVVNVVEHTVGEQRDKGHKGNIIANFPFHYSAPSIHPAGGATYKCIYGSCILLTDEVEIAENGKPPVFNENDIPAELMAGFEYAKTRVAVAPFKKMVYIVPGVEFSIPQGTQYAIFTNTDAFAALEFTRPAEERPVAVIEYLAENFFGAPPSLASLDDAERVIATAIEKLLAGTAERSAAREVAFDSAA